MIDFFAGAWPEVGAGWLDLFDIAIVAFLIYEVLKLVRRTRAAQMVLGILLVVGLYYASERAPLPTVNWLIRDMFGYIVFAAIVLFQQTSDGRSRILVGHRFSGTWSAQPPPTRRSRKSWSRRPCWRRVASAPSS